MHILDKIPTPGSGYPRDVPMKRYSESMLQIYRRTPMLKCNFNKVTKPPY